MEARGGVWRRRKRRGMAPGGGATVEGVILRCRQLLRRLRPFRRRDNHRDEAARHACQLPILAPPAEDRVRGHVMPVRHEPKPKPRADSSPQRSGACAPRSTDGGEPGHRPPSPHARLRPTSAKCPLILRGHLRRAPTSGRAPSPIPEKCERRPTPEGHDRAIAAAFQRREPEGAPVG